MADSPQCPDCGAPLPADAPYGVCPRCLLDLGLGNATGAAPTAAMPVRHTLPSGDELAKLFPNLEIIGLVGQGGMGAVYKACQTQLGRTVALKILPPEVGREPAFAERFAREARALARLNHNNIVSIFDFGQTGGLYYFVMEYVDGVNLRQALLADQITPTTALAIIPQICDALQYAHDEGIVHRDIKPENVLLDKKGRIKVADFGLAKLLGASPAEFSLTGTSQAMGTLHYMAPEQLEQPQTVDHRADIYSLGVVFYELLTGRLPLGRFAMPSEKVRIDIRLDEIVLRTLEHEPARRYQHVSEVKTDLNSVAQSEAVRPGPKPGAHDRREGPAPAQQPSPVVAQPSSTNPAVVTLTVLAVLFFAAVPLFCAVGGLGLFGWTSVSLIPIVLGLVGCLLLSSLLFGAAFVVARSQNEPLPPPGKEGLTVEAYAAALAAVRWPALALLVLGLLNCVPCTLAVHGSPNWLGLILTVITVLSSGAMIFSAVNMRSLRLFGLAVGGSVLAMLPCHFLFPLGIPIGVWSIITLTRRDVRDAFRVRQNLLPLLGATESDREELLGPPLAKSLSEAFAMGLLPMVFAVVLIYWSLRVRSSPPKMATPSMKSTEWAHEHKTSATRKVELPQESIVWRNGEPKVGPRIRSIGSLTEEQIATLDEALAKVYRDYAMVEQEHTTRATNDEGHNVIKIRPFRKQLTKLEDEFWTAADAVVLDDGLRGILREELKFPGNIFHYGAQDYQVELWRSGAWYYVQEGYKPSPLGSELPQRYRRLWPAEAPAHAE